MFGLAEGLLTKHIQSDTHLLDNSVNTWLSSNPGIEILDIKFVSCQTESSWGNDVFIIYRISTQV